ncbi:MAG: hypothetical protein LBV04_09655 [Deferribacteraceae bacterium]|jgi:hypothetical protein|nr:hypothetical protein [Deferribacteraceae bacterium]
MKSLVVLISLFTLSFSAFAQEECAAIGDLILGAGGLTYHKGELINGYVCMDDPAGKIELTYKDGKVDGYVKKYFKSGQLKSEIPFVEGKMNGLAVFYNEDGTVRSQTQYENDHVVRLPAQ